MGRFPHEVESCTPDEIWEIVAEYKIAEDERKALHPER